MKEKNKILKKGNVENYKCSKLQHVEVFFFQVLYLLNFISAKLRVPGVRKFVLATFCTLI